VIGIGGNVSGAGGFFAGGHASSSGLVATIKDVAVPTVQAAGAFRAASERAVLGENASTTAPTAEFTNTSTNSALKATNASTGFSTAEFVNTLSGGALLASGGNNGGFFTATSNFGIGVEAEGGPNGGQGVQGTGGTGGGIGVRGIGGGPSSGTGVRGEGTGSGTGVIGIGGNVSNGIGGSFTGGATNGFGVQATGTGTGPGVVGYSSGASGTPLTNSGGSFFGSNTALYAQGSSSGAMGASILGNSSGNSKGMEAVGYGTGLSIDAYSGDGTTTKPVINAAGYITVNSGSPASTTGFANTITKNNIIKAWGTFTHTGTNATQTVLGGFNIASAVSSTETTWGIITVTFTTKMANASYVVTATGAASTGSIAVYGRTDTSFKLAHTNGSGGFFASTSLSNYEFSFTVVGAQ
jgi:hypothetical protein